MFISPETCKLEFVRLKALNVPDCARFENSGYAPDRCYCAYHINDFLQYVSGFSNKVDPKFSPQHVHHLTKTAGKVHFPSLRE